MKIEQIYTGCLAQGAYYIESAGEAVIIDPLREVKPYVEKAARAGTKIKYILETHFHADFVSGHLDLAKHTGATIVYGPQANAEFDYHEAADQELLEVGKVKIKVLHTPGHTPESASYLLIDEEGKEQAIFTGDTLFIGDVGRPDLSVKSDLSQDELAGMLYDSLRNKIMPLADELVVYPAHGAGSACGKNMSKETYDTLGNQKATNYALRTTMTKAEFIKEVTTGLVAPPQYFPKNAKLNKQGYESIDTVLETGLIPLNPREFENLANQKSALILDTRNPQVFKDAFIPSSINIGINGGFAPWVGALIVDLKQPILFIAEEGKEEEVVTRLSRVGYDNTLGYLAGGIEAWKKAGKAIDQITSISAAAFKEQLTETTPVLDVRKKSEYQSEHLVHENLKNFPLDFINHHSAELAKNQPYYIHCAGGYRSMITASILKARGFDQLVDVAGGFKAIKAADLPTTEYVCPSTML